MKLQPLGDRVLVKAHAQEEITASGIVLPESAQEKPQEGEVVAVGKGRYENGELIAPEVKVGDTVIYSKYGPTEVNHNGQEYLLLSERDILAILR